MLITWHEKYWATSRHVVVDRSDVRQRLQDIGLLNFFLL